MVPPTLLMASDGKKILGNHTPTYVALESMHSFIGGSPHGKGMLQSADGGFHPGPPAQPSPKPALLLLLGPLRRKPSARRQRHLLYSQGFGLALVLGREKPAIAGRHRRHSPEARLMLLQGRHPGRAIVRIAPQNLVTAHDAVFHLVDPHQPTKLVGLIRFAVADDYGVGLEQTQHFVLRVAVAAQHPLLRLSDHLLEQREKVS